MGQDENRIEIIIDAAETKSAAKSATEANQRLSEFRKALDAFKNGVGDLNKTIETNTTTVANFNTFLKDFSVKLNDNLSRMQESVIKDFEPRLEKNLENMVARAITKVEAKTSAPGKESRSRSEPKAGAGAPEGKIVTVRQPEGYERPDVQVKAAFDVGTRTIIDGLTGKIQEITNERSTTKTTRVETWQEEIDGEIHNFSRTIHEGSTAIRKNINGQSEALREYRENLRNINRLNTQGFAGFDAQAFNNIVSRPYDDSAHQAKLAADERKHRVSLESHLETVRNKTRLNTQGFMGFDAEKFNALASKPYDTTTKKDKKGEKSNNWADPSNMMRREITGALIALHVLKVVAGNSQVAAGGFNMISNAVGHLLNVALLPMIPIFSMFAQLIHQVANVINSMPYGIRILIGGLVMWKATSTLIASMPIRDFTSGIRDMRAALSGGGDTLRRFGEVVKGIISFMSSGLGQGRLQGAAEWLGSKIRGKRAAGGPVLGHGAYIVGEKGPEIFVPKTSGSIIPNHKIGRAEGGDVVGTDTTGTGGITNPLSGLAFDPSSLIGPLAGGSIGALAGGWITGGPIGAAIGGVGGALAGGNMSALPGLMGQGIAAAASNPVFQGIVGAMNVLTGTISSMFAPLAPIMGALGAIGGLASGLRKGMGGTDVTPVVKTIQSASFAQQGAINKGHRGSNNILSLIYILLQGLGGLLGNIFKKIDDIFKKGPGGSGGTGSGLVIPVTWGQLEPFKIPAITAATVPVVWGLLSKLQIPSLPTVKVPVEWGNLAALTVPLLPRVIIDVIWGTISSFKVPQIQPVTIPVSWGALSRFVTPVLPVAVVSVMWGRLASFVAPVVSTVTVPLKWGELAEYTHAPIDVDVSPRLNGSEFVSVLSGLVSVAFNTAWSSWKDRIAGEEGDTGAEDAAWRERIRNMTEGLDGSFRVFISDLQRTLAGGVPVDIKIDVDSVTQTVKTITNTIASGANGGAVSPVTAPVRAPAAPGGTTSTSGALAGHGSGTTLGGMPIAGIVNPAAPGGESVRPPDVPTIQPSPVPGTSLPNPNTGAGSGQWPGFAAVAGSPLVAGGIALAGGVVGGVIGLGELVGGGISALGGVSSLPFLASGGSVAPNLPVVVGEKGPELFVPSVTSGVGDSDRMRKPAQTTTVQVTQHFHVTTNNPKELTDTVMRELKMELARVKM